MLTKIRIEVEEHTPEQCVRALWKYEYALQLEEANRWNFQEGIPSPAGYDFGGDLSRELVEEVIEYDESIPAYHARRVVRFIRRDTRDATVPSETSEANLRWLEPPQPGAVGGASMPLRFSGPPMENVNARNSPTSP